MPTCKICGKKSLFLKVNSESICKDCVHKISLKKIENNKVNTKNIEEEIQSVNEYVISFLKNEDLLTICHNFVGANTLVPLEFLDLVYVPIIAPKNFDAYGVYTPTTEYKFIFPNNINVIVSPYIEVLREYNDGNLYANQSSLLVASVIRKAGIDLPLKFNEYGRIYNDISREFNKIRELFKTLCNQNVIGTQQNIYKYFAFIFLLNSIKKNIYTLIAEQYAVNNRISLSDYSTKSIENIIEILHTAGEKTNRIFMFLLSLYIKQQPNTPINKLENELTPIICKSIRTLNECKYLDKLRKYENNDSIRYTIAQIDMMDSIQFEKFIADFFDSLGYQAKATKPSGDQGVDIIAQKGNKIIAIQAKHYSQAVGNHAIMEVVGGAKFYNASICYVITNNYFTKSAKVLAAANNVILWDRDILIEKLSEL